MSLDGVLYLTGGIYTSTTGATVTNILQAPNGAVFDLAVDNQ